MPREGRIEMVGDVADQAAGYPNGTVGWTIVIVLSVANILSFIDRQILALLIDPIKASLHIDDFQISLLIGPAFALFYGTLGWPLGWAVDRLRRMRFAGSGVALWSMMTVLGGFAASFPILLISRVGVGVGEAILVPAANSIIADSFPPERRTQAMGYFTLSIYAGGGLALLFGGLLVAAVPSGPIVIDGRLPWQMVLILVGSPGLLVAAVISLLPEPPRHEVAATGLGGGHALPRFLPFSRSRATALWTHFFGYSFLILTGYSLGAWAPSVLIRDYGWPASRAGLWLGGASAFSGIGSILVTTWVADRLQQRGVLNAKFRIGFSVSLLGIPCAIVMAMRPGPASFLVCDALLTAVAAAGICTGAAAVLEFTPNNFRGRVLGIYLLIASLIGSGLGPPAVAILSSKVLAGPHELARALAFTCIAALSFAAMSFRLGFGAFADAVRRLRAELTPNLMEDLHG